jgi:hypothetical protein
MDPELQPGTQAQQGQVTDVDWEIACFLLGLVILIWQFRPRDDE